MRIRPSGSLLKISSTEFLCQERATINGVHLHNRNEHVLRKNHSANNNSERYLPCGRSWKSYPLAFCTAMQAPRAIRSCSEQILISTQLKELAQHLNKFRTSRTYLTTDSISTTSSIVKWGATSSCHIEAKVLFKQCNELNDNIADK